MKRIQTESTDEGRRLMAKQAIETTAVEVTIVDGDAAAIGELIEKSKSSIVDSVRYQIAAGQCLKVKKDSLAHGEWLPWLELNYGTLGFTTRRTATRAVRRDMPASQGNSYPVTFREVRTREGL